MLEREHGESVMHRLTISALCGVLWLARPAWAGAPPQDEAATLPRYVEDQTVDAAVVARRGGGPEPGVGDGRMKIWRLALGVPLLVGGVVMAGFGISALSKMGQCVRAECVTLYDTAGVGGGLTGAGGALLLGGVLVLTIPSRQ